jgi:hypothetical protein
MARGYQLLAAAKGISSKLKNLGAGINDKLAS